MIKLKELLNKLEDEVIHRFNNIEDYEKINFDWLRSIVEGKRDDDNLPNTLIEYFEYFIDLKRRDFKELNY